MRRSRRRRQPRDARRARGTRHRRRPYSRQPERRRSAIATRRRSTARPCASGSGSTARPSSASSPRFSPGTAPRSWREAFVAPDPASIPSYVESVRLLMIGDGAGAVGRADASSRTRASAPAVHFTGLVAQEDGTGASRGVRHPRVAACAERRRLAVLRIADQAVRVHGDGRRPSSRPISIRSARCCATARPRGWCRRPMSAALSDGHEASDRRPSAAGAARRSCSRGTCSLHYTWRAHVRRTLDALEARLDANAA